MGVQIVFAVIFFSLGIVDVSPARLYRSPQFFQNFQPNANFCNHNNCQNAQVSTGNPASAASGGVPNQFGFFNWLPLQASTQASAQAPDVYQNVQPQNTPQIVMPNFVSQFIQPSTFLPAPIQPQPLQPQVISSTPSTLNQTKARITDDDDDVENRSMSRQKRQFIQNYMPGAVQTNIDCKTQKCPVFGPEVNFAAAAPVFYLPHRNVANVKPVVTSNPLQAVLNVAPAQTAVHVTPVETVVNKPVVPLVEAKPVKTVPVVDEAIEIGDRIEPEVVVTAQPVQTQVQSKPCQCRVGKQFYQFFHVPATGSMSCVNGHCSCTCPSLVNPVPPLTTVTKPISTQAELFSHFYTATPYNYNFGPIYSPYSSPFSFYNHWPFANYASQVMTNTIQPNVTYQSYDANSPPVVNIGRKKREANYYSLHQIDQFRQRNPWNYAPIRPFLNPYAINQPNNGYYGPGFRTQSYWPTVHVRALPYGFSPMQIVQPQFGSYALAAMEPESHVFMVEAEPALFAENIEPIVVDSPAPVSETIAPIAQEHATSPPVEETPTVDTGLLRLEVEPNSESLDKRIDFPESSEDIPGIKKRETEPQSQTLGLPSNNFPAGGLDNIFAQFLSPFLSYQQQLRYQQQQQQFPYQHQQQQFPYQQQLQFPYQQQQQQFPYQQQQFPYQQQQQRSYQQQQLPYQQQQFPYQQQNFQQSVPLSNSEADLRQGDGVERKKRDAQFHQIFQTGSNSQHFNCANPGACSIQGNQQIIGGSVTNVGENFNQEYHGGSASVNIATPIHRPNRPNRPHRPIHHG